MAAVLILAATTGAAASKGAVALTRRHVSFFAVPALVAAETAALEVTPDNGQTWVSTPQQLSATTTLIAAIVPGTYRVNKGASVTATAIYAATEENF